MNAPSFFVIGAQRAGTTRLCHLLNTHPDVCIPTKEPFYFQSVEAMRDKESWYRALFEDAKPATIYGEGSTYYSMRDMYPGTAQRIHQFDPNARIVYLVRHPLRRIESAWFQLLSVRELSGVRGFKDALRRTNVLIEPTLYWKQLTAYRDLFADDQLFVRTFEDFIADEQATVRDCLRFLGVNHDFGPVGRSPSAQGRNESLGKVQPWAAVDVVKTLPGYEHLKRLIPERLRIALGGRMLKPVDALPTWDKESHEYVVELVADDSRATLESLGLPPAFWDLEDVEIS